PPSARCRTRLLSGSFGGSLLSGSLLSGSLFCGSGFLNGSLFCECVLSGSLFCGSSFLSASSLGSLGLGGLRAAASDGKSSERNSECNLTNHHFQRSPYVGSVLDGKRCRPAQC